MDLTHPDVAAETLAAVNAAAGVPFPEADAAAAARRSVIHAAVENGLLALVKARWPRPAEVTLREIAPSGGVAVVVAGTLPPEEEEPGTLRLRGRISGRSSVESFRSDFLRLLAEFPFSGKAVTTAAGSRIQFGILSLEEEAVLGTGRENGIPITAGSVEVTLRVDPAESEFVQTEYPAATSSGFEAARSAWAALAPGYAWAALAKVLHDRFGVTAEMVPRDAFRDCCSLQLAAAEPLTDLALRRFRFSLEAGSCQVAALQKELAALTGALPLRDETVTLPAGSSIRFRLVTGSELACRSLRQWGRSRLEGELALTVELDVANTTPVSADLPGEPAAPVRPDFDFGAMERALDELFLTKLAFDGAVVLNRSGQLLAGKPWGTRFTHFAFDASGRLATLFFQVEWSELERGTALVRLARLERLFPLYDCRIGDVTAAAVLMESNRTAAESIEHTEVTGGTFTIRVCVVY